MSSLGRRPWSPSAASPLDDDDLLSEILLRLPPDPSSLPRASAVCKRWRLLVSDPRFLRRFRIHHRRNPPLLGCFVEKVRSLYFVPAMEAPNCVSPGRLSLRLKRGRLFQPLGCRHGLALISDQTQKQFLVWDPVTGDQHRIAFPPGLDLMATHWVNGAVLRAAGDHFQVVFLVTGKDDTRIGQRALACIYSSETGIWGDLVSTPIPNVYPGVPFTAPAVLVGDSLHWTLTGSSPSTLESPKILKFDLKRQSLAVIPVPDDSLFELGEEICTVMRAEGGGLGFLSVSNFTARLWKRKTDCDGVDSWVLNKEDGSRLPFIRGFAENNNVVFVGTYMGVYMVHLESLKFKNLFKSDMFPYYYPFECVYTAEAGFDDGHDAIDLLHNT